MIMTLETTKTTKEQVLREGLDFILSHFQEPACPRTISTKLTQGKQVIVYSKEEALARFNQLRDRLTELQPRIRI